MKAWQVLSPGSVEDKLTLVDHEPQPSRPLQAGELLVQVVSAGINPADYKVPGLGIAARAITTFPKTLGMDLSGRVVSVGEGVTDLNVGDNVLARLDPTQAPGSLSEYVIVPRDGYALLPKEFDLDLAAGAPTTALTAYQSIKPYVKAGDKIFINGGSGGTGTFGIQIAKILGCYVTVSCSTSKATLCKELGADEIIDYKTADVTEALKKSGHTYSHVVDNVGNSPPNLYSLSSAFLLPEAKYVFVGGAVSLRSAANLASSLLRPAVLGGGKNKFVMYVTKNRHDDLVQIAQWMGEGKLKTVMDSCFDFADVAKAFAHLKKGTSAGKVVVHVAPRQ
ncbi:hypothetical protein OIDMADRAFT_117349 [Oidiodendron maius Zn]|uniref:Enoyl reductase (ER) domain-containing protein n=1 Tax=Oidiodendron maius (strain Zn) TaxID=913774 RepID=A0A0C3DMT0_OIDMZ|nr:hypothetical protein OIDMADRAFT_117349 [Oidiodendron maius Zn]